MSAKTMFEKLGYKDKSYSYKKTLNKDYIVYQNDKTVIYTIIFVKEYKCIEIIPELNVVERKPVHFSRLDMDLLQAINQQVEELGWLDE